MIRGEKLFGTLVPNLSGMRDWFRGRQVFQGPGGLGMVSGLFKQLHLLCTLFLLLLYQLYLRSLDSRSQRLGIPNLGKHYINVRYY